jgi:PAS domain-containing protein
MVFLQNISIKKQSEFLNQVIDSFVHPFYVVDASDYRIKLANSAAQTGDLSKESTCYALVHQMGRPCGSSENICPIDIIKRTKQSVILEHTHYDKDGNHRYLEINAYPMFDGKGNVSDIVEYIIDISDRRKAEKALLEGEKKYHMLFESSNDAVCITTRKGDIDDCNQAFFALFGYTKDDLDKLKIQEIYHNPKDRPAFQRMVEQKEFVKD